MFDIALYGHLTHDRILNKFKQSATVGSIGNVWKTLKTINPNLRIDLQPTEIGEALIYINESISERTSVANLSLYNNPSPVINQTKFSHILYLNELQNTSFIKDLNSTYISADMCAGKQLVDLSILKNIDFLFISDEDMYYDIEDLRSLVKKSVIIHCPSGSICYNKQDTITSTVDVIENINVLGAGDMFAASFINSFLNTSDINKSVTVAHDTVSKLLNNEN